MPSTYKLEEPQALNNLAFPFSVANNGVPIFECVRLLSGSVDIKERLTGRLTKLRNCWFTQSIRRPGQRTIASIIEALFDGDLNAEDVKLVLEKSRLENRAFWEEFRAELCFCLSCHRGKNSVSAFLHLYRILELISISVPLVYSSQLSDYRASVSFIKSLSKAERDGDLSILRNFSQALSLNDQYRDLFIDFPFSSHDEALRTELKVQLDRCVINERIEHEYFAVENTGVKIKFSSVPSFVASCRNRLFHNAISSENLKLDPLRGPDLVCCTLIEPTLYWLCLILAEVFKAKAKRFV